MTDVVAIHGLNGHYEKTWTDKNTGVNWLRDLMPITSARVLSFSYNSSVKFSKSTSDLYDFADQLLEGLYASRQSAEEAQRPIIFVCHSLGGIVFKQAFVRAHELARYDDVRRCTRGVLFLGTPHRGSDLASWGTMLSAMLKAASFGTSTDTQLPKDLEPDSRDLERISQSFKARSAGLRIYSFYETEKMDFMKTVVVNRDSAVLGIPAEKSIPMDGNHRTICRFTRDEEPRFQTGMGGEKLSTTNLCYFFFKSDNYDQRSGVTALQSLLQQLFRKRPKLISTAVDYLRGKSLEDVGALWMAFTTSIQQIQSPDDKGLLQVFCVLNGLDECDDARKLVHLISETFEPKTDRFSGAQEGTGRGLLKVLVLSRPDNFIKNGFDKPASGVQSCRTKEEQQDHTGNVASQDISQQPRRTAMIRLRGEDQTDSISTDISRVVDVTISGLVRDGLTDDFLEDVKDQLIRRADRTFLWVTLIIQLLAAKVETSASRRELDQILKSRDIDAVYSEMLATRVNEPRARKMLGIILAAARETLKAREIWTGDWIGCNQLLGIDSRPTRRH
ncbi:hypothetical protein N0V84_006487 [Fusarium piperis]|uniref:Nephrocystin 3-like N-terminal domain-containing protein n=1 Tax=Fusarium piperis TaxID=1435070 RepID=A0A9W8WBR9_9HYPO|nr:hypothetical protein N0V84_006487 [Fusarium piperis]